jgi:DNA polymerase III delta subunit
MEIRTIKQQIQNKRFIDRFFVFTGEEIEAQRIYINKIAEVTNKQIKRIDEVRDAFNKRASILKMSYVFVCRDDTEFWKTATDLQIIQDALGDNILILQMTDIDKRSKAYKAYAEQIAEFHYMDADVLYKYLERVCALSDDRAYELIEMCENDYSRLLLEADKVNRIAGALSVSVDVAFDKAVEDKVISRPPKDAIFDFVDAMCRAEIEKAFSLLEECKAIGEPPLKILSVLYTNFKRVLQYQVAESGDVCGETGLSAFEVKLAKQSAGAWKSADLVYFLKTLQKIEQGIKQGEVEDEKALDLLMVQLL